MNKRVAAIAVALALLSTACGTRWNAAQEKEVAARGRVQVATPLQSQTVANAQDAPDTVDGVGAPLAENQPAALPGATQVAASKTLPCAAPSTEKGVTADTITLGTISTLSGAVPGIGAPALGAVRAYVAYRNSIGGLCGRKLALIEADDRMDSARYRTLITEMDQKVLGFAGGLSLGDDGSADIIRAKKVPMIASRSAEGVQGQPTIFDLNPPFKDLAKPIGKYNYLASQGVKTAALAYLAVDASRAEATTQRKQMEASGIKIVTVQELPLTTISYDSAARAVANSKADYMFFIADGNGNAGMARALADSGYKLKFAEYFEFAYGSPFVKSAGAAAEGAITWLRTLPNEEANLSAEVARFLKWMDRAAPGLDTDPLTAESWVAAKTLVDGIEALPGPITRQALVDQLHSIDNYDAGGMLGAIRLGPQLNQGCTLALQVRNGKWQRLTPASGFVC